MNLNKILFSSVLCLLNVLPAARAATGSVCSSNSPFDIAGIQQDTLFIEIPNDNALVTDLNVRLSANTVSGLSVRLSHGGASSVFFNQPTNGITHCGNQSFNITLDDEATTTLDSCTINADLSFNSESYKPSNALSAFKGIPVIGNWTLDVIAGTQTPGLSAPEITQWCLDYTYELPAPKYEFSFTDDEPTDGTLDFGEVVLPLDPKAMLEPVSKSLTISNTGTAPLVINYQGTIVPGLPFIQFDNFLLNQQPSQPLFTIPANGSITVELVFNGVMEPGDFNSSLNFTTNDSDNPTVTYDLKTTVKPLPQYQSTPPPGELGELKAVIGQTATKQVTINNVAVGSVPLEVEFIDLTGNTDNTVSVSGLPAGTSIVAGGSLTFTLNCTPKASTSRYVTLNLKSNDENKLQPTYGIKCTGITTPPSFAATPSVGTPIDFGNVFIGQPENKTITLTETGGSNTLNINNASISGDHRSDFTVSPSSLSINGGQSGTLEISCNPLAFGPRRATLNLPTNINDNTPKTFQYPLSCAGVGADYKASLPPGNTIAFHTTGAQPVSQSFEIWNEGNELLVVTFEAIYGEHPDDFSIQEPLEFINGGHPVITIPAGGARKVVTLMCHPQAVGERKAVLTFMSNDPGEGKAIEYPLLCKNNASDPKYKSNPSSAATLAFGNSLVGEPVTKIFKIRELGNDDLKVDFVGFEGEHASDFSLVNPKLFPLTIANDSGAEPEVQILCMPSGTGQRTAVLKLKSNDMDKPNPSYQLRCQGILKGSIYASTPAPHSVLNFGYVRVTQSSSQLLIIRNKGNRPLKITNISIKGEHADDFSLSTQKDVSLANNEAEFALTVTCEPQQKGLRTATLNLKSNDSANETIEYRLACVGTTSSLVFPEYASNPPPHSPIDVGNAVVGTPTSSQLVISQQGDAPLKVELIGFEGQNAEEFKVLTEFPLLLSATAEPVWITAQCTPSAVGLRTATLKLKTNDHVMLFPSYFLSCQGHSAPRYHSKPAPENTLDFGELLIGNTTIQEIMIAEHGDWDLKVDLLSLEGPHADDFTVLTPQLPMTLANGAPEHRMRISCRPSATGLRQATLTLKTNDPQLPTPSYPLNCQGSCYRFNFYPQDLDFGIEPAGASSQIEQRLSVYSRDCVLPHLNSIELTGSHADEFSLVAQHCYNYYQGFSCQYTVTFSPLQAGVKEALLNFIFDNGNQKSIPLSAQAIEQAEAKMDVYPIMLDFGSVTLAQENYFSDYYYQSVWLHNKGNVNLKVDNIHRSGPNANDFAFYNWPCQRQLLKPSEQCALEVRFTPKDLSTLGARHAELTITTEQGLTAKVKLQGQVSEPHYCQPEQITIESSGAALYWTDTHTWNLNRTPNRNDVVRINSGHSIIAKPLAHVAVLCIEPNAQLLSADEQGTPLQIQAARYIANKGEIIGRNGRDEQPHGSCLQKADIHEQPACAQRGASVVLKVGRHIEKTLVDYRQWWWHNDDISGPILNEGKIIAGDGGKGNHYGANGGHALVISQNIINKGVVIAGDGGDITGLGAGRGGLGGITQLWANLSGKGYLYNQADAVALAGDGGQCQPNAVERQTGGVGGDLWLMASYLYLKGGLYQAGQGGSHCFRDGEPGQRLRIEPNLIDISGAQTQIQGDDIAIYGGKDWRLNFSHLNTIVVEAEDKLTLAVGEGGVIDFRGNQVPILQAQGQVNIFADTILLDEGITLADLIEAKTIEVGPQRILRAVSLTGAGKFVGAPGETIPVQLILANNSPETDQFTLESLDPSGQMAAQLPTTLAVPGLSTVELILSFTLPATEGSVKPLTITAISQAAPAVQATHSFQLAAVTPTWVITQDNDIKINDNSFIEPSEESEFIDFTDTQAGQVPVVEQCPTTGFINWVCRNDGQIMSDVHLGRRAAIAGGSLEGIIDNYGLVSQVTLKADAVLRGGKLSGYILNQGWLESFEFVGAAINGGTLAGHIVNNSRIGGVLRNVNLAAHTQVRGGYLAGTIQGNAQAPALLEQLTIKAGSTVSHVIIGSGVNIAQDVVLATGVQWQ